MIAFFSTLFLTLIICVTVGAIIISCNKKSRLEQEVNAEKTLNKYGFVGQSELYADTREEYDADIYEFIDSDLDESDNREYDQINYDKLNYDKLNYDQLKVGGNETVEPQYLNMTRVS
jgi:hypothetical protein